MKIPKWLANVNIFRLVIYMLLLCTSNGQQQQQFLTANDFRLALDEKPTTFLTENDFQNARKYKDLLEVKARRKSSILTQQRFYRGDIRGKAAWRRERHQKLQMLRRNKPAGSRRYNGVASVVKKWPNGRIPYVLGTDYSERERAILARAFQEYQSRTCIRFVPKTPFDHDFLYIGKIDGCFSDVGRAGGKQELSLDDGCLHVDTVIHELMHSVGFYHEHERWDRDNYLVILWQNIDREAYDQFGRVDLVESNYYGQNYDYHSIMHYDSLAFSRNGRETLLAREPAMTTVIGSATDFSPVDLAKIHKMYQCLETSDVLVPPLPPASLQTLEFTGDNSVLGGLGPAFPPPPPPPLPPVFRFPMSTPSSSLGAPLPRPFFAAAGMPIQRQSEGSSKIASLLRVNSRSTDTIVSGENHQTIVPMEMVEKASEISPVEKIMNTSVMAMPTACQDKLRICPFWLPYCHFGGFYERLLREYCANTCEFCKEQNGQQDATTGTSRNGPELHTFPVLVNAQK